MEALDHHVRPHGQRWLRKAVFLSAKGKVRAVGLVHDQLDPMLMGRCRDPCNVRYDAFIRRRDHQNRLDLPLFILLQDPSHI